MTTHESFSTEKANAALDLYAYNALNNIPDSTSMYGHATSLAATLGYRADSFEPYQGVKLVSAADSSAQQYVPGVKEYNSDDHVRGVSSTIANAPLPITAKVDLLDRLAVVAASKTVNKHAKPPKYYKQLINREIYGQNPPMAGQRMPLPDALYQKWHPGLGRRLRALAWVTKHIVNR